MTKKSTLFQEGVHKFVNTKPIPYLCTQMKYNLMSAKRNKSFLERLKEIPPIAAVF